MITAENSSTPGDHWCCWVSLSKSHSNIRIQYSENGIATHYYSLIQWFMYKINLQILPYKFWGMQKILGFIYWRSILGWYSQPCHEQWNGKNYGHSILGWYRESCHDLWNSKDYWHCICLAHAVGTISNTDKDRLRIMHLGRKTLCRIHD